MKTALALLFLLGTIAVRAADLATAMQPIADGVPEVAVVRLRALLQSDLTADDRKVATAKLAEALVASGRSAEALPLLSGDIVHDVSGAKFTQAQAFAALGEWNEALAAYSAAASQPESPLHAAALFGKAEALRALDRTDETLQVLNSLQSDPVWRQRAQFRAVELLIAKGESARATTLLDAIQATSDSDKMERRLLRARIAAALGHQEKAISLLAPILKHPEGARHPVLIASLFASATAHLQNHTPGDGDDLLEDFIEHRPTDPDLPAVFAKLDELYAAEKKPSRHELERWSRDSAEPRRALSRWYLARAELRLGHRDFAEQRFAQMRADHPPLPALAEAFLEEAQLLLGERRFKDAEAALAAARAVHPLGVLAARVDLLAGRLAYATGQFAEAAKTFHTVEQSSRLFAHDALYDASVAWLQANDVPEFAAASQELKAQGADERARGDLQLEEGLVQAANRQPAATDSLRKFLQAFPKHPRASEAWVALAELAFQAKPPRLEEARQDLVHAAENQPTPAARERADYLQIWIDDASLPPNEDKVIARAREFIEQHETSPLLPEVRLKLAETYYNRQDFASAQTQFDTLAQRNPDSPVAEKAQFFAAESAMRSMGTASLDRALVLFDAVVKKDGDLKWAARNEQAVIERKLGKPDDALTLYDEVLKGDAKPGAKREALCAKGDILYELGGQDRANYQRAIDLYGQLAAEPDASAHWRNQALFKKGMCLEKLQMPAEALATFYQVVENENRNERRREFFWFYKAGFNAARLLEEDSKWQPAAAIYEKLAFAGGGRSEEAKARLNRLRLEHFLWDQ